MVGTTEPTTDVETPATENETSTAKPEPMGSTANEAARAKSGIAFPYSDLNFALQVVRTIRGNAGSSCTPDQLAGWLGQNTRSGAFAQKLSTARTFGLIETDGGAVRLTDIGQRAVDPAREREARADAFLHVPLYKAIFEKYKGYTMPPPAALEREIANLGVPAKQTDKARQAFDRSAEQAGF